MDLFQLTSQFEVKFETSKLTGVFLLQTKRNVTDVI